MPSKGHEHNGHAPARPVRFEAVLQAVDDLALPLVEWDALYLFPEAGLFEDDLERFLCPIDGATEAGDKPLHPGCYVEVEDLHRSG